MALVATQELGASLGTEGGWEVTNLGGNDPVVTEFEREVCVCAGTAPVSNVDGPAVHSLFVPSALQSQHNII